MKPTGTGDSSSKIDLSVLGTKAEETSTPPLKFKFPGEDELITSSEDESDDDTRPKTAQQSKKSKVKKEKAAETTTTSKKRKGTDPEGTLSGSSTTKKARGIAEFADVAKEEQVTIQKQLELKKSEQDVERERVQAKLEIKKLKASLATQKANQAHELEMMRMKLKLAEMEAGKLTRSHDGGGGLGFPTFSSSETTTTYSAAPTTPLSFAQYGTPSHSIRPSPGQQNPHGAGTHHLSTFNPRTTFGQSQSDSLFGNHPSSNAYATHWTGSEAEGSANNFGQTSDTHSYARSSSPSDHFSQVRGSSSASRAGSIPAFNHSEASA